MHIVNEYSFKMVVFKQEDLLSASDGTDVIVIENFPTNITEKVCLKLNSDARPGQYFYPHNTNLGEMV